MLYRITGNFCSVKFLRFWTKKKTFYFNFCRFFFLRIENLDAKKISCITGNIFQKYLYMIHFRPNNFYLHIHTCLHLSISPWRILIPSITIRAAIIAFVVAIAGIILPAIAEINHSLVNTLLYITLYNMILLYKYCQFMNILHDSNRAGAIVVMIAW